MNIYIFGRDSTIPNSEDWLDKYQCKLLYYPTDADANLLFSKQKPDIILTVGENSTPYKVLSALPSYIRKRWTHVNSLEHITPSLLDSYFVQALEAKLSPVISIFTSAYKSGLKIMRPFHSIQQQTFSEWEWIIMDDSPEEDKEDTWDLMKTLAERDCRIRVYKQKGNDGYIGSVKHTTASMARGLYILEMDHDDELLPTALADVVTTFENHPDVDMVGSDCSEIYEDTLKNHAYCEKYGYGRHSYYKQFHQGRWVNVSRNGPLDQYTIRHIVGVLNHLRAWRYSTYVKLRGHDFNLNVVDDYELIIRTFLHGKIARLPKFLYVQYRNEGGNNFTFIRNKLIQKLVGMISRMYDQQIHDKLLELELPDFKADEAGNYRSALNVSDPISLFLSPTPDLSADVVLDLHPEYVSIIMPTYDQSESLKDAVGSILDQKFQKWVLYIVGDKCPTLEETMCDPMMRDPRIKYWNLETHRGDKTYSINYGLKCLATTDYIAYLEPGKYWQDNHLSTLYKLLHKDNTFALSSFESEHYTVICKEPKKFRLDMSSIMHKRSLLDKYGYWNTKVVVGIATDFELVSRWLVGREKWRVTLNPSLFYDDSEANMKAIYDAYNDQED